MNANEGSSLETEKLLILLQEILSDTTNPSIIEELK